MIPRTLSTAIVSLVTIVWSINIAAPLWHPTYQSDPAVNFVFMAVVGGAIALRRSPDGQTAGADGATPDQPSALSRVLTALAPPAEPPPPTAPPESETP